MTTGRPPSLDALARSLADIDLPQPLLVDAARRAIANGRPESARELAESVATALLRPVINATGVLLHTNLGRAPLEVHHPARYTNLELDLPTGRRGSRSAHAATLLARAAGAEAALVVNNGAAAVLLVLAALARGRPVLVSRGELVEIGGGFRIPDVMAQSGAQLTEVGTTNRTRIGDYRAALTDDTALVLKVHRSNYRVVGFTEEVEIRDLAALGPPVVYDIGSGLLDASTPWIDGPPTGWLAGEPAAVQSLAARAALVTFSGDKLLGGPQAGIIAGRADLVATCARHPLARALRPGGLVLGALQDVALTYLRRESVPFWRMAAAPLEALQTRAQRVAAAVPTTTAVDCASVPGGGSLPGTDIPSAGVAVDGDHADALRTAGPVPVIARVHANRTICDLRTFDPTDDAVLTATTA